MRRSIALPSRSQLSSWIAKGFLSILDQAIYSGANFVMIILLARWLNPVDFGAFSVTYAIFSVVYQLHNGFISEPMSVLGPIFYQDNQAAYIKSQTRIHWLFTSGFGMLLILAAFLLQKVISKDHFEPAYLFLGITIPFLLLPWFTRRVYYLLKKPILAVLTSFLYAIFLFGLLYFGRRFFQLNSEVTYIIMAASAVFSALYFFFVTYRKESKEALNFGEIISKNWHYGKWIILTGILTSFATQVQIFVTGSILGLETAGVLRAIQNFIQPMIVVISALAILVLPSFASQVGSVETKTIRKKGLLVTLITLFLAVLYEGILWGFGLQLEYLLYGGKYSEYTYLIPLFGLVPIIMAFTMGPSVLLRAFQKPDSLFSVSIAWAVTAVITSLLFISLWGINGAFWSVLISQLVATSMFLFLYRRRIPA